MRLANCHFKKVSISICLCFGLVIPRFASNADAEPAPESALSVVRRSIEALGGPEAIRSVKSLRVQATCSGPRGPFETEVLSYRPESTLFRQESDRGSVEMVVVGDVGWTRDRESGEIKPLSAGMRSFVRSHEFHLLVLEMDQRYSDHAQADPDSDQEGGSPAHCQLIEMRDRLNLPVSVCIASDTNLPARMTVTPAAEFGDDVIRITFEDWKRIDGVMYFHSFTLYQGEDEFRYKYQSIQPNGVDPSIFVVPEGLSAESQDPEQK